MICGYLACAFDLLNVSDLDAIGQAQELCDRLTVGVYSDELIEHFHGLPAIVPMAERVELVKHIRGVDEVVVHDEVGSEVVRRADRHFLVQGDRVPPVADAAIRWLVPARTTASPQIREALAPKIEIGVA